ncbi:hypothetical protein Ava_B0194 (plasmid) [Trichormus variabilis ATCC 29413]|uniref:Uncharacterized protein n=3 Tax=Nostocales TaxID=1161 RepID=Q3M280_TRIV2|nr:hypothetical protein [Trichormus variabilis]MBC1270830.1 hypothetical protein [Trichormus variabilis FSR]MBC1329937.1 hypothetical protein [Trichormus variabilis 9RC]QFZ14337.1 hypothetical protein EH233_21215 [Anabaena sp. YBS01]ABA24906.1 hypothetical protein Ava_B0194 [Trichormus variabilis ATCC 29413]MBC1217935.1 hypothetical protein [Trichormus variabilis ARAD]
MLNNCSSAHFLDMDIYFLSDHAPDPEMIKDLGALITTQIRGDINGIQAQNNLISFNETLFIGGQKIQAKHTIPAESIVIVEAPPILQADWLAAGVSTLLVTQMKEQPGPWGTTIFKYCGLVQIHKIEVVTSPWKSKSIGVEDIPILPEDKQQLVKSSNLFSMANLFQKVGWKPIKQHLSPW